MMSSMLSGAADALCGITATISKIAARVLAIRVITVVIRSLPGSFHSLVGNSDEIDSH